MSDNISDLPLWADDECYEILKNLCAKYGIEVDTFKQLIEVIRTYQRYDRARGINDKFKEILS